MVGHTFVSFPASSEVVPFPRIGANKFFCWQQRLKPEHLQRLAVCLKAYPDTKREVGNKAWLETKRGWKQSVVGYTKRGWKQSVTLETSFRS
jgi:hypothetical protein